MASSPASSTLKPIIVSTTLLSVTIFFLLVSPTQPLKPSTSRILLQSSPCSIITILNKNGGGIFSYSCILSQTPILLSIPILALHFYFLIKTAGAYFSPVVTQLSAHLRLSPSMAAVTLLALGNGAPDVFASAAALRGGQPRTGLAAILSAGTFVSAFVVGSVAAISAPFRLDPAPFIRDVFFYLLAVLGLFYVYLSAEIFLWQAVGFVGFYVFFVRLVFWMDFGGGGGGDGDNNRDKREEEEVEMGLVEEKKDAEGLMVEDGMELTESSRWSFFSIAGKISWLWEVPVTIILKLTIPSTSPSEWSRFYTASNICLCPLAILYSLNSFIGMDTEIVLFLPQPRFPLWFVVFFISLWLGAAFYFLERESPRQTEAAGRIAITIVAFVMSVFWISTMAGELLNCLAAVGTILDLPPAILGLTVLAWGNSIGDLVADVALAKAGQPVMAMAGCFVGPMFNMLVGLGTAMVIETTKVYPGAYELKFNVGIVVAFVFLLLSLMGSLLVVTWCRFRVPRFWGFCLVGLYLLFTAVSLAIAIFSS